MAGTLKPYRNILVAIDFSPSSAATLTQALWLAKVGRIRVVLASRECCWQILLKKVLSACRCSVLTIKPEGFESPILE